MNSTRKRTANIKQEKFDEIVANAIKNKIVVKYRELNLHPDFAEYRSKFPTMFIDREDKYSEYGNNDEVSSVMAIYGSRDSGKQGLPLIQYYTFKNGNPISRFIGKLFASLILIIINIIFFLISFSTGHGIYPFITESSMVPFE